MATRRFPSIVAALLVGLLLGAAIGVTALSPSGVSPPPDPENPPWSYSTATGCVPADHVDSGWLVATTHGNARSVAFNVTVAHDVDEGASVAFRRSAPGRYVLELDSVGTEDGKSDASTDCIHGSTVQGGVGLPTDYDEVAVVYDGVVVRTIRNDGTTMARHWTFDLPTNRSG